MPKYLIADYLHRMQAFLDSYPGYVKPRCSTVAKLLAAARDEKGDHLFPFRWLSLQQLDLVKNYVQALKEADIVSVADKLQELEVTEDSGVKTDFFKDSGTVEGKRVKSLADLLEACAIDLEVWEVERYVSNKWEVGAKDAQKQIQVTPLYQIKAWLRKKRTDASESAVKALLEEFKGYTPPVPRFIYQKQQDCAAVINLLDAHIDKVCLVAETGYGSTIEDNIQEFERLFDTLLTHCATYTPELIILPVGHDFFNTNGPANTTKRGTPQATTTSSEESFKQGTKLLRRCIDKAKHIAPVKVKVIKANHSEDKDFYLGQVLEAVYEKDENVEVDTERRQRKYEQYGINLFGFAHGDKEKGKTAQLPLRMAEEEKHRWAETTYRTFYLGDIHHKEEYQFLRSKDYPGVLVKFLRSVGTTDMWHYDNGYIGIPRTGEVEIHSKTGGIIGQHFAHAQYTQL
jgi:hypothetical protein